MSLVARLSFAIGAWGLLCTTASASDGFAPRTPVLWEGVPCLERVDRSSNPVLHFSYAIPHEDTERTPDEVEDSRTHQFFAFCRRKHALEHLPNWITWADVEAARESGALTDEVVVGDEDVLETNSKWAGCWSKITPDDERRPITQAMADQGVDWDTTGLEPGGYTIYGYTHHPPLSPWYIRPGVVKVHDGNPDAAGPVAATFPGSDPDIVVYNGATVIIEGCIDSALPAMVSGYYALGQAGEPNWVPFAENQSVAGDVFTLELFAAPDIAGRSSIIRIDVTDPSSRERTTYMDEFVIVLEGTDPNACRDEGGGFIAGPECDDDGQEPTGGEGTGGDSSTATGGPVDGTDGESGPPEQEGPSGCACAASRSAPPAALALLLLGVGAVRRRSRVRAP